MTEFEVKPKKPNVVKIKGQSYQVRRPTIGEIETTDEAIRTSKGDSLKIMKKHMIELGLTEDAVKSLDLEDFMELFQFLSGAKKND